MEQLADSEVARTPTYRIAKGVRFRRENFGGLMFQRPIAVIYGLTSTACRTLELCDGTRDIEAVAAQISHEYGAPKATVSQHITAFLAELQGRGFVEETRAGEAGRS